MRNWVTHAEELLWDYLRTKPSGYKFKRQHPYAIFILDFYCHALKLVIEVDGSIHDTAEVRIKDKERQNLVQKDGLRFIRFRNEEIFADWEEVKSRINILIQTNNGTAAE